LEIENRENRYILSSKCMHKF